MNDRDQKYKKLASSSLIFLSILAVITIISVISYGSNMFRAIEDNARDTITGNHYAFICENEQEGFYRSIYDGAYKEAEYHGDYLENVRNNLTSSYDKFELMDLAIDAKVNGIIVEAGENEKIRALINRADAEGIPVITVGSDNTSSARKSYVGFGYYDLGVNYGKELLKAASDEPKTVLLLMSPDAEDSSQNIIYQGIRETLERAGSSESFKLNTMAVPDTSAFGAEEVISSLIMKDDSLPDVIICLNEIYTTCVCQSLVDYNRVGDTVVYGFYENSTILSAIKKNIIYATLTMDTHQMGRYCIDALKEYEETGYVNEYMPADIKVITADNIDSYISEKETEESNENTGQTP